jgi:predicted regulator of Ras-like GTPase activity (Roadblock/LC7/MglB family)
MGARPISTEPRTLRSFFQQRLALLRTELASVRLAAIASEDGLLIATDDAAEPNPLDRRAAVGSSFLAVARTAARELQLADARCVFAECEAGLLVLRPFVTQQGSGPKRRLLLVVLDDPRELGRAVAAARVLAEEVAERLGTPDAERSLSKPLES